MATIQKPSFSMSFYRPPPFVLRSDTGELAEVITHVYENTAEALIIIKNRTKDNLPDSIVIS